MRALETLPDNMQSRHTVASSSTSTLQSRRQLTPPWRPEESKPSAPCRVRLLFFQLKPQQSKRTSGTLLSNSNRAGGTRQPFNLLWAKAWRRWCLDATKATFTPRWKGGLRRWQTPKRLCKTASGFLGVCIKCSFVIACWLCRGNWSWMKKADHLMTRTELQKGGVREEADVR